MLTVNERFTNITYPDTFSRLFSEFLEHACTKLLCQVALMMRHLKCIFETALALKLVLTNTSLILPNTNNFCLRLHPSSTFQLYLFSFTELCSDYKINYYQLFFDVLQLMPTPTMSCSKTRGLPGLPPIPTGEMKEQSALYEVVSLTAFIRKIYDLSPVLAVTLIIATSNANVVTSEH